MTDMALALVAECRGQSDILKKEMHMTVSRKQPVKTILSLFEFRNHAVQSE